EEGGNLRQYPGNYSVYLDFKKAEEAQQQAANAKEKPKNVEAQNVAASPKDVDNTKRRRLSNWEKKEFQQLEGKIAQLEAEKAETEKTLANVSAGNYSQVQKLYNHVEKLKEAIDVATERWLELAEMES
ncbi:MAG: ABC transporter C-terminal domain-containing protein, partial [Nostoc sp.]